MSDNNKNILVIGAGGHAKVLLNAAIQSGTHKIAGLLDKTLAVGTKIIGYPVLGNDDKLAEFTPQKVSLLLGVGTITGSPKRKQLFEHYKELGYEFISIFHPQSVVAPSSVIGEGSQIMAGAIIQPDVIIGTNCIINTGAIIEHDCKIASSCHICPGAVLGGNVTVGESSLIGLGAKILPGINIGKSVTIGAGAVVTRNVEDNQTLTGIPAQPL